MNKNFQETASLFIVLSLFIHTISSKHDRDYNIQAEFNLKCFSHRACEARTKLRHALPITDFEKKKPTVLQSKRISKIQDSRVPKNLESTRGISAVDATRILYTKLEQLVHRSTESQKFLSFLWYFAWRFSMDSF